MTARENMPENSRQPTIPAPPQQENPTRAGRHARQRQAPASRTPQPCPGTPEFLGEAGRFSIAYPGLAAAWASAPVSAAAMTYPLARPAHRDKTSLNADDRDCGDRRHDPARKM